MTSGERLRLFRENRGLNQTQISKVLNIPPRNWSRYETEKTSPPQDVLINLAKLGLDVHWYMTGEGNMLDRLINYPNGGKKNYTEKDNQLAYPAESAGYHVQKPKSWPFNRQNFLEKFNNEERLDFERFDEWFKRQPSNITNTLNFSIKIQELGVFYTKDNTGLEKMYDLPNGYLSKFEKNEVNNPSWLPIALAATGINVDWFFSNDGPTMNSSLVALAERADAKPESKSSKTLSNDMGYFSTEQIKEAKRAIKLWYDLLVERGATTGSLDKMARQKPSGIPLVFEGDKEFENGIVIPVLEDNPVSAGYGAGIGGDDVPTRYIHAPRELAKYPHLMSLPVRGDSMDPTLHDGDMVVCDGGGWDGDGIYVIKTIEETFVKRVLHTPQGYRITSDNKLYESYTGNSEEIAIVGKVRAAVVMMPGKRGGI